VVANDLRIETKTLKSVDAIGYPKQLYTVHVSKPYT